MPRPILLLVIMAISFSQSEIMSPSIIKGVMFPLLFAGTLLMLLIWFLRQSDRNRRGDEESGDYGGEFFGGGKNSDADSVDNGGGD